MEENFNPIILLLVFFAIVVILAFIVRKKKSNKGYNQNINENKNQKQYSNNKNYFPYHKKFLLTKNEYRFYKTIKEVTDKYGLSIIAKVRLADLVEVNSNLGKYYMAYFQKIQSKHIDFAVINPDNMNIEFLIELDDSSHNNKDRIERDTFVNELLKRTGYKLFRTYGNINEIQDYIKSCKNTEANSNINDLIFDINKTVHRIEKMISCSDNNEYKIDYEKDNKNKIITDTHFRLNRIEKILSDVDEDPYVIEKED